MKKKFFRKIPNFIEQKVFEIQSPYLIAATTLIINEEQIKSGEFEHLGIKFVDDKLYFQKSISPQDLTGRYAKRNIDGYDIIHRDQPKIHKTFYMEVPNFGDSDKGYHEISFTRLVYPRTHVAPREWNIRIELLNTENFNGDASLFTFKIIIDTILCKKEKEFRDNLLFAINLLQENTSSCDIYDAETKDDVFLKTRTVGWEIFPASSFNKVLPYLSSQLGASSQTVQNKIQERFTFLESLNPIEFIVGLGGNKRYVGAKFNSNLIVFENIEYGNAIYILFENWEEISKMSRIEILQRKEKDFIRLRHDKNWQRILKYHIERLNR